MSGIETGLRVQNAGFRADTVTDRIQNSGINAQSLTTESIVNQQSPIDNTKKTLDAKHAKLQKATQEFEAVFIGMMLKQMRKSLAGENALFGKSSESKMYQEMMDDTTAQQMSKVGTFGLAKVLYKTLDK